MEDAQNIADRYAAVWNEPDAARRRAQIAALWSEDGDHYVGTRGAVGYAELEERIRLSHDKNVAGAGNRFRAAQDAQRLRNTVVFHWHMLPADGGTVLATGLEVLILGPDGRIRTDYQFIVP